MALGYLVYLADAFGRLDEELSKLNPKAITDQDIDPRLQQVETIIKIETDHPHTLLNKLANHNDCFVILDDGVVLISVW